MIGPLTMAALARSNTEPADSFVYFVGDPTARQIKIGIAKRPFKRLSELQVGSANALTLVGVLAGGGDLEAELHEAFAGDRMRGEWFRWSDRLNELIQEAAEAATRGADPRRPRGMTTAELGEVLGIGLQEAQRLASDVRTYRAEREAVSPARQAA